nr:hypothetical protein [Tanacetum cinerariifolium]
MGPTSVGQKRNTSEIQGRYGRRRTIDHRFLGLSGEDVESERGCVEERAEVYYECKEPFKSLKYLRIRSKSIAATWLEKVVTPLIEPAIKGFAAASAVLKSKRLKVDKHSMSEPMSYYLID